MTVTFCGHSQFHKTKEYLQKTLAFLEEKVGDQPADIYLGNYGSFDSFAFDCCKELKKTHPKVSIILVVPYLTANRINCKNTMYDSIIYPEIENKPKRYAITYCNRYMVEKADFVVAYITHDWGGAYKTYKYAKQKKKEILNISGEEF